MEKAYRIAAPGGDAMSTSPITHSMSWVKSFTARGFTLEGARYILEGELILTFRKPV
jgi:hypothetical protein